MVCKCLRELLFTFGQSDSQSDSQSASQSDSQAAKFLFEPSNSLASYGCLMSWPMHAMISVVMIIFICSNSNIKIVAIFRNAKIDLQHRSRYVWYCSIGIVNMKSCCTALIAQCSESRHEMDEVCPLVKWARCNMQNLDQEKYDQLVQTIHD